MILLAKETNYAVVDQVFEESVFKDFWKYFNSLSFAYRSMTGWQKVWKISDGQILASSPTYHSQAPFNSPMDLFHKTVMFLAKEHFKSIVGKEGEDWNELFFTPYIYPSGTKISWHDDCGYTGACIFYPHQEWSANWGGELMLAKTPAASDIKGNDVVPNMMTRKHIDPLLNHYGMGAYIAPLPNRLVFTSGKVWHAINRVDQTAGDNVRCSIVGFFTKEKPDFGS